ncbi:MAG: cell division protein FtsQ/DivIB [Candidatus Muirbacterium halophilum]|nr:cell division protein FtsQ/DivIB [Candidatus Muirbacterium halophilum]MCK9475429.1 cell division protein FtsQ/DivIB [Candidatus Muirbacterium halophilum]
MRYNIYKKSPVYLTKIIVFIFLIFVFSFEFQVILKDMDFLNVREIQIIGNNIVDTKTILFLSKITRLKNIIKINIEESKKLIETHPFVKTTGITVNNAKITINIRERDPFVFFNTGKKLLVLDNEGYVLNDEAYITDYDLPVLTGIEDNLKYYTGKILNSEKIVYGLKWFRIIPIEFWSQISEINVANHSKIVIYTLDGMQIFVDNIKTFPKKFEILYSKLLELKEKKFDIEYFDLRTLNDDLIYMEYKEGGH